MRRSVFTVTLFASAAFLGCEDGPNQTFSPAPANAGAILNNGSPDASFDPGAQNFDASYPGKSLTEICSTDEKRAAWAKMLDQPIIPPRKYAGIDMGKSDLWEGLKIEEAEQAPPKGNCQSTSAGSGGCPSGLGACGQSFWGDNQEVSMSWNLSTHIFDQMVITSGHMTCYADTPGASGFEGTFASGNNSVPGCKNNPACMGMQGVGPIPTGTWVWNPNGQTSKPGGRVLEPVDVDAKNRTLIRTHSCGNPFGSSKNGPFCSEGCVTGTTSTISNLNGFLGAETNNGYPNILIVVP